MTETPSPTKLPSPDPTSTTGKVAEGDEITRLITSSTIFPIPKQRIPYDKRRDVVYYNPVVKQDKKNGIKEFRVRGTAGGNLLTVPYDVSSARTDNLEEVKILIHSTLSTKRRWASIDIKDFYLDLGTSLLVLPGHYEHMRIHRSKLPLATIAKHHIDSLFDNDYVYFEVRKCLPFKPKGKHIWACISSSTMSETPFTFFARHQRQYIHHLTLEGESVLKQGNYLVQQSPNL